MQRQPAIGMKRTQAASGWNGTSYRPWLEEYIRANNTCALATGAGSYVRCTPIEYS